MTSPPSICTWAWRNTLVSVVDPGCRAWSRLRRPQNRDGQRGRVHSDPAAPSSWEQWVPPQGQGRYPQPTVLPGELGDGRGLWATAGPVLHPNLNLEDVLQVCPPKGTRQAAQVRSACLTHVTLTVCETGDKTLALQVSLLVEDPNSKCDDLMSCIIKH